MRKVVKILRQLGAAKSEEELETSLREKLGENMEECDYATFLTLFGF